MSRLEEKMAQAAPELQPTWTAERARRVEQRLLAKRRRTLVLGRARNAVALAAMLLALGAALRSRSGTAPSEVASPVAVASVVSFADGSSATILEPAEGKLEILESGRERIFLRLLGSARFVVAKDPSRQFRVEAGPIAVEVIGTRFMVEAQGEQRRVTVDEGRVRVITEEGEAQLEGGQSEVFPKRRAHTSPEVGAGLPGKAMPSKDPKVKEKPLGARSSASLPADAAPSWRQLAQEGEFERAFEAYRRSLEQPSDPKLLLLLADVARFSHHPEAAIEPLERLLAQAPSDPLAPLAAFTLGRVRLEELGHPEQAAQAFLRAVELAPSGPLAEDALARAVEAFDRAGDAGAARRLGLEYLRQYPEGRRKHSVRRFGGLDAP